MTPALMERFSRALKRRTRRREDGGSLFVLEAIIIVLILAASLSYILAFRNPATSTETERIDLALASRDSLILLDRARGDDPVFGNDAARQFVTQALYGDSANLTGKLLSLLPPGARFSTYLDNGLDTRELAKGQGPARERVTVERGFGPMWATTLLMPDFEKHVRSTGEVKLTALPVYLGRAHAPASIPIEVNNGTDTSMTPALDPRFYEVTLNPIPATSSPGANSTLTNRGQTLHGRTSWTLVTDPAEIPLLSSTEIAQRTGLAGSSFAGDKSVAAPSDEVEFTYDLSSMATTLGAFFVPTSMSVNISLIAPVPAPTNASTSTLATAWSGPLSGTSGTWNLTVPRNGLFGTHLVDMAATYSITNGATTMTQTAHLVTRLDVTFKDGTVAPLNPAYRLVLEVWFDDWS